MANGETKDSTERRIELNERKYTKMRNSHSREVFEKANREP